MDLENEICPLCGSGEARDGRVGISTFDGVEYAYVECLECNSMHVSPMPQAETMMKMFGDDYQHFHGLGSAHSGEAQVRKVLSVIRQREPGVFFDYGCGSGALLVEVFKAGWEPVGFDFSEPTVQKYRKETGLNVVSDFADLPDGFETDVLNFGDVLAHLTDIDNQFSEALKLVKRGGLVVVEGTLEANPNVFHWCIRTIQKLRESKNGAPPYDVILATRIGQRKFFERHGLSERQFEIFESDHPAPERLGLSDLKNPRAVSLFTLRKLSKAVSSLSPNKLGNRFFYVGVKEQ